MADKQYLMNKSKHHNNKIDAEKNYSLYNFWEKSQHNFLYRNLMLGDVLSVARGPAGAAAGQPLSAGARAGALLSLRLVGDPVLPIFGGRVDSS